MSLSITSHDTSNYSGPAVEFKEDLAKKLQSVPTVIVSPPDQVLKRSETAVTKTNRVSFNHQQARSSMMDEDQVFQLINNQKNALEGMKLAQRQSQETILQLQNQIQLQTHLVTKQNEVISRLELEKSILQEDLVQALSAKFENYQIREPNIELSQQQQALLDHRQEIIQLKVPKSSLLKTQVQIFHESIRLLEHEKTISDKRNEKIKFNEIDQRNQLNNLETQLKRLQTELEMKHLEIKKLQQMLRISHSSPQKSPHPKDLISMPQSPMPLNDLRSRAQTQMQQQQYQAPVQTRTRTQSHATGMLPELSRRESPMISDPQKTKNVFSHLELEKQKFLVKDATISRTLTPNRLVKAGLTPSPKFAPQIQNTQRVESVSLRGRYQLPNGDTYEGELQNGQRHGYGILKDRDGDEVYAGYWANDTLSGSGMLKNKKCSIGTVVDYQKLIIHEQNWMQYSGQLQNNLFQGIGNLLFTNKERYQGSFTEGTPHGTGTYIRNNGDHIRGQWKQGIFIGKKQ